MNSLVTAKAYIGQILMKILALKVCYMVLLRRDQNSVG